MSAWKFWRMRSGDMRKRRKRKSLPSIPRLPWALILWAALIVNCWAGVRFSHITDLRVVRVEGASLRDQANITNSLQAYAKSPALKVTASEVESQVLNLADVDHAQFQRNVFGEGRLKCVLRQPAVQVFGTSLGLTLDGCVVPLLQKGTLPVLRLPVHSMQPIAGLAQPMPLTQAVSAAAELHKSWPSFSAFLTLSSDGTLDASDPNGPSVELGDIQKLSEKFDVLHQIFQEHPELFQQGMVINIADPQHPVQRKGIELRKNA